MPRCLITLESLKVGVIGLGYVGLPLAIQFGKIRETIGYDTDPKRIAELNSELDSNDELVAADFKEAKYLRFSAHERDLADINCFIVTVPTPVDKANKPDLTILQNASRLVAKYLSPGALVIFESTVFPGATEEECVPLLESVSGLRFNVDFYCGYSPERINPGDPLNQITQVVKVTSGSTPDIADIVDSLYREIIPAGTFRAKSIKVAEAAKVIENAQRDLNIAFVNELAIICDLLGIDTASVLEVASSKWNFLPFSPGLVGGHCIGVDPYYLTYKAETLGYLPQVILAGRRTNDGMADYLVSRFVRVMTAKKKVIHTSRALVMGITFKENCNDSRNSQAIKVVYKLRDLGVTVSTFDPIFFKKSTEADIKELDLINSPEKKCYDAILVCVAHDEFRVMGSDRIRGFGKEDAVIFDVKSVYRECEDFYRL